MTYILLDVIREMRILQPSSMVQISRKNPDRYIHKALDIIRTGFGQPSCFSTEAIVQELLRQGKVLSMPVTEVLPDVSKLVHLVQRLTGLPDISTLQKRWNWLSITALIKNNTRVGLETGYAHDHKTFEDLLEAFKIQVNYLIDIKIRGNNVIMKTFAEWLPVPFLSLLVEDCISSGKDYNNGGARYNTSYIQE